MIASCCVTCYNVCRKNEKGDTMKLLLVSDSHHQLNYMRLAVGYEQPDAVIHLGDCIIDADELALEYPGLPVLSVRGNCDICGKNRAEELVRTFEGVRVFGIHGHRYGVKQDLLRAEFAAREAGAQVLAFGHTHQTYCKFHDGLWRINPGACSASVPTYGIVCIENGNVTCAVIDLLMQMEEAR